MAMLEWNDALSTQIAEVDKQHKRLVEFTNQLYDSIDGNASKETLLDIVAQMRQYTIDHFSTEERHMDAYNYPETAEHKYEHTQFVNKVAEVERDCHNGDLALSMDILNFLSSWLVTHISDCDHKMGAWLYDKGLR